MPNKTGVIAQGFPDTINVVKNFYTPSTGNRFTGQLRVVNQSGTVQSFRYAITPDATAPSDTLVDAKWYVYDLPLDTAPYSEGINIGVGQRLWIRASSLAVAFQLNGRENLDT